MTAERNHTGGKKTLQTAVIVLVCVIVANGIALETSEAFPNKGGV